MLSYGTPVEDYRERYGLTVKREDLSCPPPGPPFSKTRGVWAHMKQIEAPIIGVLDTFHSQAGHAVARAGSLLGKRVINFFPDYKHNPGFRDPQARARELGAELVGIPAGRSAILYHKAKRLLAEIGAESGQDVYMMPNALKLAETVTETAAEVRRTLESWAGRPLPQRVIVPASSATIAAGVINGFAESTDLCPMPDHFVIHLGYSRSQSAVERYLEDKCGGLPGTRCGLDGQFSIVDEGYAYKDKARSGETPPWPCNAYYDLKAFRWWWRLYANDQLPYAPTLFWNVG